MKKKNVLIVMILSVFLIAGCKSVSKVSGTGDLNVDYLKKIPHLANRIYVKEQGVTADKMCDELLNILASRNHMTVLVDREKHYITTETKDVGHSTLQRMIISIEEKGDDSQMEIITQWRSGSKAVGFAYPVAGYALQEDWSPTQWEKNRLGIALAESAAVANEFKNGAVSYIIEQSDLAWYNRKKDYRSDLASNKKKKEKKSDLALKNKNRDNKKKNNLDIQYVENPSVTDDFNYGIVSNESEQFDMELYNKEQNTKIKNKLAIAYAESETIASDFYNGIVSNDTEQFDLALNNKNKDNRRN
jgi:hypothetical protein